MVFVNFDEEDETPVSDDDDLPTRFSDQFYLVTMWTFLAFGWLSLVGDALVLAANHFMNDVPRFIRRIVCLIVFCEMFNTIFLMWGMVTVIRGEYYSKVVFVPPSNVTGRNGSNTSYQCKIEDPAVIKNQACVIQAFISNIMSMGIYMHVAYLTFLILISNKIHKFNEKIVNTFLVVPWLIIIPMVSVAAMDDVYGYWPCTFICWCVMKKGESTWMYINDTAWEFGMQVAVYTCYALIFAMKCRKNFKLEFMEASLYVDPDLNLRARKILQSTERKICFFPLIFTLCYLPGAVDYFIRLQNEDEPSNIKNTPFNKFLHIFHGVATNSTGICNFLVFVAFNERARKLLLAAFRLKFTKRGRAKRSTDHSLPASIGPDFIPAMNNNYRNVDFLDG